MKRWIIQNFFLYKQMERFLISMLLEDKHFITSIYYADIIIKQAINQQNEMEAFLRGLSAYRPHTHTHTHTHTH